MIRLIAILIFLAAVTATTAVNAAEKLNVLFILADDLRPELGCYGAPVHSPNLDKLAGRGVRFERAYCQYPLCNPSRASLMTGRLPTATGVLDNSTDFRKAHPDWVTLPQLFKNNGYTSVRIGKNFHGGIDDPISWSEGAEPPGRRTPRRAAANQQAAKDKAGPKPATTSGPGQPTTQPEGEVTAQMRASDQRVVLTGNGESHPDYKTADAAIAALERLKDQPFFITCGFTKPHAAPSAPQRFYDLYPPEQITLPADFSAFPKPPSGFPAAAMTKQNTDLFWNREANADEARLMIQAYRASASWMDWNAGRVLDALDRLGLSEKTIVVFWGDHGYHLGEMGKWSKHGSLFETGTRVPLIIAAPGIQGAGKSSSHIVQTLDIYPTLAALCDLTAPAELAGHDLSPLLNDPHSAWTHPAFSYAGRLNQQHRSIRTDRWRYIEWTGPEGGAALIDEQNDPHERTNLINDPAHTELVLELKTKLDAAAPATTQKSASVKPLFPNSVVSNDLDFIKSDDPTATFTITSLGRQVKEMPDKRSDDLMAEGTLVLSLRYADGPQVEVWAAAAIGDETAAQSYATHIGRAIGKLPQWMRNELSHVVLHAGNEVAFAEEKGKFFVLYSENIDKRLATHDLEETVFHESVHATLEARHANAPRWLSAQQADPGFITDYAAKLPRKEDLPESALFAFTLLQFPGRLPAKLEHDIRTIMPNRLEYLQEIFRGMNSPSSPTSKAPGQSD